MEYQIMRSYDDLIVWGSEQDSGKGVKLNLFAFMFVSNSLRLRIRRKTFLTAMLLPCAPMKTKVRL